MAVRRILFLYISVGSGHQQAADSIVLAVNQLNPQIETLSVNSFNYLNPLLEKVVNGIYMGIIRATPEVWDYLYDNPKIVGKTAEVRKFINKINSPGLIKLVEEFRPDVIVCTQAFPAGIISAYKEKTQADVSLIAVPTDYIVHSYWVSDKVNLYIVPSDDTKKILTHSVIPDEKILPYGIPINPLFRLKHDRERIFQELNLNPKLPVVLIMGGSQGLGELYKIAVHLEKIEFPFQILIVTGTNGFLRKKLERKQRHFRKITKIFGFVNKIYEFMEISSLIITKAGGLTVAESLAKGLPLMIIHPIPGQEEKNTQFLLSEGVALRAENVKHLTGLMKDLFAHPEKLEEMRRKALALGKPNAAMNIANLLINLK